MEAIVRKSSEKCGNRLSKNAKYFWEAHRDAKPKELPVKVYIDHVFHWVNPKWKMKIYFQRMKKFHFLTLSGIA